MENQAISQGDKLDSGGRMHLPAVTFLKFVPRTPISSVSRRLAAQSNTEPAFVAPGDAVLLGFQPTSDPDKPLRKGWRQKKNEKRPHNMLHLCLMLTTICYSYAKLS